MLESGASMDIQLTSLHWVYLAFILFILGLLIKRRDTTLICVVGIFTLGLIATESLSGSVSGIFNSFIYATKELLGTIFIISIIVAMSRVLIITGINETMVAPLTRFLSTPTLAFWGIGVIMLVTSLFFWPSPGVALIGAVLLPVALRVGLPALGAAMAMNLFGHGIALSGDYIIQGAPKLTADAAGLPVSQVMEASVPLVIVMGVVTTVTAFWLMRRDQKNGTWRDGLVAESAGSLPGSGTGSDGVRRGSALLPENVKRLLAVLIPLLFVADVAAMFAFGLQGGDATALIGGTAVLILIVVALLAHRNRGLEETTVYMVEGFQFGFRVFGPVIPIAAFFYLGDSAFQELFGDRLLQGSHGIVNDIGVALANLVPVNGVVAAITLAVTGAITGLDGSGFSGISLVGSIAHMFGVSIGSGMDTLTALGQVAAIWVGGGTLIPWALIPAAAICAVSPFELARRNLLPVMIGLAVTTVVTMFLV
jgi:hypothetical protein